MITAVDVEGEQIRLGTYTDAARELGVTTNQVYAWYTRRNRNGFPAPIEWRTATNGIKSVPHFDVDEIRAWRLYYTPSKGGAGMHGVPIQRRRSEKP